MASSPQVIIQLVAQPLTKESFAPFGDVIDNPLAGRDARSTQAQTVDAQSDASSGSAVIAEDDERRLLVETATYNLYHGAPSRKPVQAVLQLLACKPQSASEGPTKAGSGRPAAPSSDTRYAVESLQRHPFTAKRLIPVGVSSLDSSSRYLIIVAPTLAPTRKRQARPPPFPPPEPRRRRSLVDVLSRARPPPFPENTARPAFPSAKKKPLLPGPGLPDLQNARAFLAHASQAVIYGPGVWHAPVMVVGTNPIEFVLVQHVNGVPREDRQEVLLSSLQQRPALNVLLTSELRLEAPPEANEPIVKAKL